METCRDNLTREGEIGEMKVQLDLTQQGFVVSVPLSASTNGYDLICDSGTELLKVQVKSVKKNANGSVTVPLVNRKNSSVAKNNRGQTHRYSDLVNYIAVSVKKTDDIYYIPTSILPQDKTTETFLLPEYLGRSNKTRLGAEYTKIC
jgi:hypothetical protein